MEYNELYYKEKAKLFKTIRIIIITYNYIYTNVHNNAIKQHKQSKCYFALAILDLAFFDIASLANSR